jgi:hypothetical protein
MTEPDLQESLRTDEPEVIALSEEELAPVCNVHICQTLRPE